MGELGLDGFADRVFAVEAFFDHLFHDGDIENVAEKAVHLDNVFKREPEKGEAAFHLVESTVDLFFHRAADVADAVA